MKTFHLHSSRLGLIAVALAAVFPCATLVPFNSCAAAVGVLWLAGAALFLFVICDYADHPSQHHERDHRHPQ